VRAPALRQAILEARQSFESESGLAAKSNPAQSSCRGKIVYVAVPRLRDEKPFIELDPAKLNCSPYAASSIKGAAQYGTLIDVDEVGKIDLIVCGSVAVNRRGARVGKGGGYSDLEFALFTENKRISAKTPIVTSVHALQIVDENLPMTEHDIPLSAIVTPDEVFETDTRLPRPKGIYWDMLADDKIDAIPVLKSCRSSS
jgi:5-formyltetrahydrofolate cyclo-ligase